MDTHLRGYDNFFTITNNLHQHKLLFIKAIDIHFNNLLKYLCRDELSRWGVKTSVQASEYILVAHIMRFFYYGSVWKKLLIIFGQEGCEYIE